MDLAFSRGLVSPLCSLHWADGTCQVASRPAAYEIGFVSSRAASITKPKFIYLLNADEVDPKSIPQDAFVVYQGHHGDLGAQFADVVLPGAAYTEKSTTWVNTEGRPQLGRAAVPPPGASREDWKVIRYVHWLVFSWTSAKYNLFAQRRLGSRWNAFTI